MLAYLFPMTCGTAITFNIRKETVNQKITTPLLILPKTWNNLAQALKLHDPKKELPEYNEDIDELAFRKACVRSIYAKPSGKESQLSGFAISISDTSEGDVQKNK